ncbi:hypothetical protein KKF32_02045 [Patescibacteria group bacterium]|nr:hypothetical protein [Patescibacteria group bacterium]
MDKIAKALKLLNQREKNTVADILTSLENRLFKNLDIKKLKGHDDIFRARKGKIRIIYRLVKGNIMILAIERRSENTYKKFKK